uniref:Acetyl-CoA carboxylase beta subunit n=1 Tax=Greenwayodendron suaveolens TaxID=235734 RepID=A0A482FFA1_9MAGN|nr:acetyl-CoA carboxylase beta subunit [Greenwayodendron suaveolens]QBO26984.1 acetyl-CoA carboxylase beta subunit [Greenwayodendron suaveolens]
MEKRRLNLILFKNNELERSTATDSLGRSIGNTSGSEDPIRNDTDKNIHSWSNSDSYSCSNVDYFLGVGYIWNFISDNTFFVRDNNGNNYFVDFDMENQIFEIDNDSSFLSKLEISFSSSLRSKSHNRYDDCDMYDTQYSWNNHIKSCIESYLCSEIRSDSELNYKKTLKSNICEYCGFHLKMNSSGGKSINDSDIDNDSDESISDSDSDGWNRFKKFKHLWVVCENCYISNYKKTLKSNI